MVMTAFSLPAFAAYRDKNGLDKFCASGVLSAQENLQSRDSPYLLSGVIRNIGNR